MLTLNNIQEEERKLLERHRILKEEMDQKCTWRTVLKLRRLLKDTKRLDRQIKKAWKHVLNSTVS